MKKVLTQQNLDDILSIIRHQPAIRFMHFSDSDIGLCKRLKEVTIANDYEYKLHILQDSLYESLSQNFEEKNISLQWTNLKSDRYTTSARFYDYLFVSAKIEDEMMEEFIKNVYRIIKSGGNIIMILKKEVSYLKLWQILEENFFVAINSIELSSDYNLLIAKKMHGWGG